MAISAGSASWLSRPPRWGIAWGILNAEHAETPQRSQSFLRASLSLFDNRLSNV